MIEAPPLPSLNRRKVRHRPARPTPPTAWTSGSGQLIEVIASTPTHAAILLDYASPLFPVQLVAESELIVRLQPIPGPAWVLELLALLDRWLISTQLPCVRLRYGGRSYIIRAPIDAGSLTIPVLTPAAG
jgi:hypothetical protein